jgi:predicted metal-dependent peptidase
MVEYAPSTGGLALWVAHQNAADQAGGPAPAIATDGLTVFYGAAFDALPLAQQTGLVAHEVLHIALRHPQRLQALTERLGDVDAHLFNICADAIVNSALEHLQWLQLPRGAVKLDQLLRATLEQTTTPEAALLEWDVERLYLALDDRQPPASGTRSKGEQRAAGAAPDRPDGHRSARARSLSAHLIEDLKPATGPSTDPERQAEETREWSERLQRAHAGDGAYSMLRSLVADLPRTRTPWEQVLRTLIARHLSRKLDISWSRPSRSYLANRGRCGPSHRMPFEPGFMPARAAPRLVVVVDVSGSIDAPLLERFSNEITSITRRLEVPVTLVVGDERVQHVAQFEPGRCRLADVAFHGGGGTDFTPLLEEADSHGPDLTVVLTDLQGPARFRPRAPVIWAVPEQYRSALQPFGRKLVLG